MSGSGAILCIGEMLLRLSAPLGTPLSQTAALRVDVGGAEANVAVALATLGHDTAMFSAVPDGPLGDMAVGHLRRFGVDTRKVVRGSGRIGTYYLDRGGAARPATVVYDRADSLFTQLRADAVDWDDLLRGVDHVHLSGIVPALGENATALATAALAQARQRDLATSFDANFRPALWRDGGRDPRAILRQAIGDCTILFGGARDAELLFGHPVAPDDAGPALLAAFPRLSVVAALDRVVVSQQHHRLTARIMRRDGDMATVQRDIFDVRDRIGSGDAFAAGVLHALRRGADPSECAETGLALAGLSLGVDGDATAFDTEDLARARLPQGDVRR